MGTSGDGDVVVVGVVPLLLRNSRVTSPDLQLDPVSRVAPRIQAIVGSAQLDLAVSLVDVPELVGAEPGALGVTSAEEDQGPIGRRPGTQRKTLGVVSIRVDQFDIRLVGRRSGSRRRSSGRRRGGSWRRSGGWRGCRGRSHSFGGPSLSTGATAGLGSRSASSEPTASTCTIQADRSSGDGDMVVIGVVPPLIGKSGVTGPELGRSSIHRVAASVQAEVGSGQPHDLVVTLGDLEAGGSRSTRDVV